MSTDPPQDGAAEQHSQQAETEKIGVIAESTEELMAILSKHKPWGERVRRTERVSEGFEELQAEEAPDIDEPGEHATILDPTVLEMSDSCLAYEVILPDGFFGVMVVYENPHPGPMISAVYEYFGLNPQQATPSDLYMKNIPVREVTDDGALSKRWVLDLPGRSSLLHRARRYLQDRGIVTWDNEALPYHREKHPGHKKRVPRELHDEYKTQNIGVRPQTKPSVTQFWKWLGIGVCVTLAAASLALGLSLVVALLPILLLIVGGIATYCGLIFSRQSTEQLTVPVT